MAHISAEDLMSYADYSEWKRMKQNQEESCDHDVKSRDANRVKYERISCRAWTDLLLQLLKVIVESCYCVVLLKTLKMREQTVVITPDHPIHY